MVTLKSLFRAGWQLSNRRYIRKALNRGDEEKRKHMHLLVLIVTRFIECTLITNR
jgi:hypothetical protein